MEESTIISEDDNGRPIMPVLTTDGLTIYGAFLVWCEYESRLQEYEERRRRFIYQTPVENVYLSNSFYRSYNPNGGLVNDNDWSKDCENTSDSNEDLSEAYENASDSSSGYRLNMPDVDEPIYTMQINHITL